MTRIAVKDLVVGDTVCGDDGRMRKIVALSPGLYRNSTLLQFSGDWSCVPNRATIEVQRQVSAPHQSAPR